MKNQTEELWETIEDFTANAKIRIPNILENAQQVNASISKKLAGYQNLPFPQCQHINDLQKALFDLKKIDENLQLIPS